MVWGFGFGFWVFGLRVLGFGFWVLGFGVLAFGFGGLGVLGLWFYWFRVDGIRFLA